ncbi:MAG: 2-oxoglutarate dehydrogenase E1 component [Firmicutes bacterium]|nr:2-oxoglutarate dehydrogenase E1 component [Bacillota bacterium]
MAEEPVPEWLQAAFPGPNLAWAVERWQAFREHPEAVDPAWRAFFAARAQGPAEPSRLEGGAGWAPGVRELAQHIRAYGYLQAAVDPLEPPPEPDPDPAGLSPQQLAAIPARTVWPDLPVTDARSAWDVITRLKGIYCGHTGYDFSHVHDPEERRWLQQAVEEGPGRWQWHPADQLALLWRLVEVEEFERFLHRTFPGQKRFSIEGLDMLVPMLELLARDAAAAGIGTVVIGMAHRGRLNVLAHILGKPYEAILAEFHQAPNKDLVPSEGSRGLSHGWMGDVRYHLGAESVFRARLDGEAPGQPVAAVRLILAHNPSHLEFVNPVVQGMTRALQEAAGRGEPGWPRQDPGAALAVAVHGDAAFPGEGIVAETLNLARLAGYRTGGTVHLIANNGLGFTAGPAESRSTPYASDLAKGFAIPVVHVNADDPTACLAAVRLALAYRARFGHDFVIDLVGYRRWGHNEGDDPTITQPLRYARIARHPPVAELWARTLTEAGVVDPQQVAAERARVGARLAAAYQRVRERGPEPPPDPPPAPEPAAAPATGADRLRRAVASLSARPPGFHVHPRVARMLDRRFADALTGEGRVDWGLAELLAFATLLQDGVPVRLSGQDSERGTFSQRHQVLHDVEDGSRYLPLHHLADGRAAYAVYNSPLSEAAVLGFEYGYSVEAPEALVLWEAQYGDFANAAQVHLDQFVAAGAVKWRQTSGLVLLLPHGYEGQGPEHSSARMERFLALSADGNWQVAIPTTAAQYFHLLREQGLTPREGRRPLVVFTPKSLLRNPRSASPLAELAGGGFRPLLDPSSGLEPRPQVERVLLAAGKVAVELEEEGTRRGPDPAVDILRLERLYPFPAEELAAALIRRPQAREVVWVQEEPANMGAWSYIEPRLRGLLADHLPRAVLRYVGRPPHASPAEGSAEQHLGAQAAILAAAWTPLEARAGEPR